MAESSSDYPSKVKNFKVFTKSLESLNLTRWDPMRADWVNETPTPRSLLTIKKDITKMQCDPPPGIMIVPDEEDITFIHCLLIGPVDTPYEGGFFYFILRFPPDYPMRAPRVKLMTTGEQNVRFNPNLYKNGKICLSILGTWTGPSWSPAQNLWSVFLSIQSIMNDKPYFNEPGFERQNTLPSVSLNYNAIITHETIRVAVCSMLEGSTTDSRNMPQSLREFMEKSFLKKYDFYTSLCQKNVKVQTKRLTDPYGDAVVFDYERLLQRLQNIRDELNVKDFKLDETKSTDTSDTGLSDMNDFLFYDSESSESDSSQTHEDEKEL